MIAFILILLVNWTLSIIALIALEHKLCGYVKVEHPQEYEHLILKKMINYKILLFALFIVNSPRVNSDKKVVRYKKLFLALLLNFFITFCLVGIAVIDINS